jgi:anthranilate synthase/aminodeoxychorismate synthase-like glutamine amidotransferase
MLVIIDHYDSFVHNLASYFEELEQVVEVVRSDKVTLCWLEDLYHRGKLDGIVFSPGPKTPEQAGASIKLLREMEGKVPILGVCLGHQILGYAYGGKVCKGALPMHGKVTPIENCEKGIFENLPKTFQVTRYHSLIIEEGLPPCLRVDARDEEGIIMAVSHRDVPVYGIQFHPEAVLTEYGHELLKNFILICQNQRKERDLYHVG